VLLYLHVQDELTERYKMKKSIFGVITSLLFASSVALADPTAVTVSDNDLLLSGQTTRYGITCNATEMTLFVIVGDGDGDIDCCLLDENANVVECDNRPTDGCVLRVTPAWTGKFYFVATNTGKSATYYRFNAS